MPGPSRWSSEEKEIVKRLWGTIENAQLAAMVGRTLSALNYQATQLNIRQEKGYRSGSPNGQSALRWTNREKKILIDSIGHLSLAEIQKRLPGRTIVAIETKCCELGYRIRQGSFSRADVERDTGYGWHQIKRAREALKQEWKRCGARTFIISEDQRDDIIEYLKDETTKWCRKYNLDCCIGCGTSGSLPKQKHSSEGKCKACCDKRRYERSKIEKSLKNNELVELQLDNYNGITKND